MGHKFNTYTRKIEPEDSRDVNSYQTTADSSKQGVSEGYGVVFEQLCYIFVHRWCLVSIDSITLSTDASTLHKSLDVSKYFSREKV